MMLVDRERIEVDPFGFAPAHASRIRGLGGAEAAADRSYAFHTPYVATGAMLLFTLRPVGLVAGAGTLTLRINALPLRAGAQATVVRTVRVRLADLARAGETTVRVACRKDHLYALLGTIDDAADAAATDLSISVERRRYANALAGHLAAARRAIFGWTAVPSLDRVSAARPTLAEPTSQMCTAAQFEEPVYAEWLDRLKVPMHRHRKQWEFIYILQALRHHGALRPDARGVGFGVGTEPLPAMMAALGCHVTATDLDGDDERAADWRSTRQHGSHVDSLRRPDICPDDILFSRVSFRPADMTDIPADLRGFDFTWSSCAYEHLGSIGAGLRFVEDSLACLRPGGVAVHTTEFNLASNDRTLDEGGTVLFRRRDFEQLARDLTTRGHAVAPLNFDAGDHPLDAHVDVPPYSSDNHLKLALAQYVSTSFGIIIRKG